MIGFANRRTSSVVLATICVTSILFMISVAFQNQARETQRQEEVQLVINSLEASDHFGFASASVSKLDAAMLRALTFGESGVERSALRILSHIDAALNFRGKSLPLSDRHTEMAVKARNHVLQIYTEFETSATKAAYSRLKPELDSVVRQLNRLRLEVSSRVFDSRMERSDPAFIFHAISYALGGFIFLTTVIGMVSTVVVDRRSEDIRRASEASHLEVLGAVFSGFKHTVANIIEAQLTALRQLKRVEGDAEARKDALSLIEKGFDELLSLNSEISEVSGRTSWGRERTKFERILSSLEQLPSGVSLQIDDASLRWQVPKFGMTFIVRELLANAIKATSEPTRRVTITACRSKRQYVISVVNNGEPIPSKIRSQLGRPFVSSRQGSQTKVFGLGLFSIGVMIRQVGGTLNIDANSEQTQIDIAIPGKAFKNVR